MNSNRTDPTKWIMAEGTRKTPLPMTVPMTMEMALHKPSTRCKLGRVGPAVVSTAAGSSSEGRCGRVIFLNRDLGSQMPLRALRQEHPSRQADKKRGTGSDQHIPRVRNRSEEHTSEL